MRLRIHLLARACSTIAVLTVALALPTPARADARRDASAADALFQAAKSAMARGDHATACARFAESQRLDPAPGTLLNLAACETKRGKLATAQAHVIAALETLPSGDYRLAYAKEQAAALAKRVPKVTVKLAGPGRVKRDGVELGEGALGVALPVDPGTHVFVVEAEGRRPTATEVTIGEGETKTLELRAGEPMTSMSTSATSSTSSASSHDASASAGNGRKAATITSFVVGGAGLATGIVTGLMFASAAKTYDEHCDATGCDPEGLAAASRAKTLDVVSPVAFAVGALGVGAGTYLLLTGKKEDGAKRAARVDLTSSGVVVRGTF